MEIKDYKALCETFFHYSNSFKETNGEFCKLLEDKIQHIKRVAENAVFIAKNENWSKEDVLIAELCGLYHDIGRFSQYKKYKTFSDAKSVNHGQQGFDIIKEKKFFKEISRDDAQTILDAVHYHNALNIPDGLSNNSVRFTKLTRDADKIDIFFMLTQAIKENNLDNHRELLWNLPIGEANPIIIDKLMNNSQALYSEIKSGTDVCLLQLCWIYGINYNSSLVKIRQNQTIELLASIMPKNNIIAEAVNHINNHIDSKLSN